MLVLFFKETAAYSPKHGNDIPVCCWKRIHGNNDHVHHRSEDDDVVEIWTCQFHNSVRMNINTNIINAEEMPFTHQ